MIIQKIMIFVVVQQLIESVHLEYVKMTTNIICLVLLINLVILVVKPVVVIVTN